MKYVISIFILAMAFAFPFGVNAQGDLVLPEVISEPIADNGLSALEEEPIEESAPQQEEGTSSLQEPLQVLQQEAHVAIHKEKLNWNSYRFRPSFRIGQEEFAVLWSFGDGQSSEQRIIEHTYAGPGSYVVQLELFDEEGQRLTVSETVQVGFFNLANWKLWVLILLLALIIIIAAIVAGSDEHPEARARKKKRKKQEALKEEEELLESLSEETADLDTLAEIGFDTEQWAEELDFLEELSIPPKKRLKKTTSRKKTGSKTKKAKETKKKTSTKTKKKAPAKKKATKSTSKAKKTTKKKTTTKKKSTKSKKTTK